jgi:flavodoxin
VCPKHEKHLKESGPFLTASYNLKKGIIMKKKMSLIMILIIFMLSESVFSDNATQQLSHDSETNSLNDNSTLILYYSMTGKTKIVAEKLNSLISGSKLVEVKSDASIPAAIFWYKLPFTKADIEPININFNDYDRIFLCTPIYMQGISPAIKAVIKDIPMKDKKVSVLTTCGGFYGFYSRRYVLHIYWCA